MSLNQSRAEAQAAIDALEAELAQHVARIRDAQRPHFEFLVSTEAAAATEAANATAAHIRATESLTPEQRAERERLTIAEQNATAAVAEAARKVRGQEAFLAEVRAEPDRFLPETATKTAALVDNFRRDLADAERSLAGLTERRRAAFAT